MILIAASLLFLILCTLTFFPVVRLFYVRNPAFGGMILTLIACFMGVYLAIELSQASQRGDRMARAATLMEMTKESLSYSRMESQSQAQILPASNQTKELADLLNNGAVLEQISPVSLKTLLASQVNMQKELSLLSQASGRNRRYHLNRYMRELAFAQGVLTAEAEFQRGNIGRKDLSEILSAWIAKNSLPSI